MSSKTKIIVLHMKEIIYTGVFAVLAILLFILFAFMFSPKNKSKETSGNAYTPGVYTSSFTMNSTHLEVEVTVDSSHINAIRFRNLDESVTTMYPLIESALDDIATQIYDSQSLENITLSKSNPYTSQVVLNAIKAALKKAEK